MRLTHRDSRCGLGGIISPQVRVGEVRRRQAAAELSEPLDVVQEDAALHGLVAHSSIQQPSVLPGGQPGGRYTIRACMMLSSTPRGRVAGTGNPFIFLWR